MSPHNKPAAQQVPSSDPRQVPPHPSIPILGTELPGQPLPKEDGKQQVGAGGVGGLQDGKGDPGALQGVWGGC